jgi:hypothetical protein
MVTYYRHQKQAPATPIPILTLAATAAVCSCRRRASAPGQTVKPSAQTIATGHHLGASLSGDVTPGRREPKPSAHLVERPKRRLKPKPRVPRAVTDAFGNIEAHAIQSLPNLRGKIPISPADGLDQRPSRYNELKNRIEEKLS